VQVIRRGRPFWDSGQAIRALRGHGRSRRGRRRETPKTVPEEQTRAEPPFPVKGEALLFERSFQLCSRRRPDTADEAPVREVHVKNTETAPGSLPPDAPFPHPARDIVEALTLLLGSLVLLSLFTFETAETTDETALLMRMPA
jgi:hypothetical protein